ncbi:2-isopropylmalate synthase [Acidobacteria bacterium ACD]|nr:MAG: 2-isopropylmalate synthase [Acidobacteriota bacterium]MDL1951629.1 2-isopropylmalate synthase [Acidobacteria bacterium ACD]
MDKHSEAVFDWNAAGAPWRPAHPPVAIVDETLRDGLQSPSVRHPRFEQKVELLRLVDRLGIDTATIGLPGAGAAFAREAERLVRVMAQERMRVRPACAARTLEGDIRPIVEISQRTGVTVDVNCFLGSSPIRRFAEDWTLDRLLLMTEESIAFCVREGLPVLYVTEDSTRARPEDLAAMYRAAIGAGARRICVSDTVGHATPTGVRALLAFVSGVARDADPEVRIDWHGHQDRGLGVVNSLAALESGAQRVHGCALGIGERVGNTPLDQLLVNLKLMGAYDEDLSPLAEYVRLASVATGTPIPPSYPFFGRDAFRTSTGVHAAAILKAQRKGDDWLADRVYSSVPSSLFGRQQEIEVGPMSGESNVVFWLGARGYEVLDFRVEAILAAAKASDRVLSDDEIEAALSTVEGAPVPRRIRRVK